MAGRFSVSNLFKGINDSVQRALRPIVLDIYNRVKPFLVPVLRILALVQQLVTTFRREISQLAKFIQRTATNITRDVSRSVNNLGKDIRKLPRDFNDRLFRFGRNIDSNFRKTLSPFQKAVTSEVQKASNNVVKFGRTIDKAGKDVTKLAKDVKNIPKNAASQVVKSIGDDAPKIINKGKTSLLGIIDDAIKRNSIVKTVTKTISEADTVIKPLAKNSRSLTAILSRAPGLMDDLAKFLKPVAKGSSTALKAVPILGDFWQALDWEYFKREFNKLFRQVNALEKQINELYNQNLKSRSTEIATRDRIINIERMLSRLTGTPIGSGGNASTSGLTPAQINAIANAVAIAVSSKGLVNPQQIAQAVSTSLSPQLQRIQPVNYQEIQRLMLQAVAPLNRPVTANVDLSPVLQAVNGLKPLFPNTVQLGRDISTQVSQSVTQAQNNSFSNITNQITSVSNLLQTVNQTSNNTNKVVNNISNTTTNNGVTLSQLLQTENKVISEVRKAAIDTQKAMPTIISNAKLATAFDAQTIASLVRNLNVSPRITVNPTPVTVSVPQTLINQINSINPQLRTTVQQELAKLPKPQPDPRISTLMNQNTTIYNLLGGNELRNGIQWDPELMIKGIGEQIYNGSKPLVNNLPMAMALVAAPLFMRGGLHKFPASIPSDLNNPNANPTVVNHAVGLQQAYHGLIDQRLGSPVDIKVKGVDGQITASRSRSINESLDTITAQNIQADTEMEILQQTVAKLAAETMAIAQMVLVDHDILESLRDFCGYRYTEEKRVKPTELSLGKESLLDWFKQSNLHYIGTKFDGKMDLTEMLQRLFLEIGKVSNSTFQRFDPNDSNQKIVGQNFSNPKGEDDDNDWLQFVKFVKETPGAVQSPTDPKPNLERYTNNDTTAINVTGTTLPQG